VTKANRRIVVTKRNAAKMLFCQAQKCVMPKRRFEIGDVVITQRIGSRSGGMTKQYHEKCRERLYIDC